MSNVSTRVLVCINWKSVSTGYYIIGPRNISAVLNYFLSVLENYTYIVCGYFSVFAIGLVNIADFFSDV